MADKKSFIVLALTREDIAYAVGQAERCLGSAERLSDAQMDQIAEKTSDALYELELWDIIGQVAEEVLSW